MLIAGSSQQLTLNPPIYWDGTVDRTNRIQCAQRLDKITMVLPSLVLFFLCTATGTLFYFRWKRLSGRTGRLSRWKQAVLSVFITSCIGIFALGAFLNEGGQNARTEWGRFQKLFQGQQGETVRQGMILAANRDILAESAPGADQRDYPKDSRLYLPILDSLENAYQDALLGKYQDWRDEENGFTVVTTLRPEYQEILANALESIAAEAGVPTGQLRAAGVILDVTDENAGAVLAMVSLPSSGAPKNSPKTVPAHSPIFTDTPFEASMNVNRAILGLYPPGSTFKIITVAAALDLGLTTPTEIFDLRPYISQDRPTLHIYRRDGVEVFDPNCILTHQPDLVESFVYSCNSVYAMLAGRLTPEKLVDYAARFKFEQDIRLGQLYVASSRLDSGFDWTDPTRFLPLNLRSINSPAGLLASGFGQGELLVTPLHMAMIASAIAKGGVMFDPYLVSRLETADAGQILFQAQPTSSRVIAQKTARVVNSLMNAVVTYPGGSGFLLLNYPGGEKGAIKTGTAAWGDGNSPADSWAVGYWPVDRPKIAFAILIEQGGPGYKIAVPVVGEILRALAKEGVGQ